MSARIRLIVSLTLLSLVIAVPAARAQDAAVLVSLERQTPFAICDGPCEPGEAVIDVAITATNTGDTPIEDLALGLVLAPAVDTRGDYERSLDPAVPLTTLYGVTRPQEGSIPAGKSRTFETAIDLTEFKITPGESHIYPLSVDVRSADVPLAELRTPVLFFFQPPIEPLAFTWTVEMAPPITFGPDGVFADDTIEREIAPDGRIAAQVEMLRELAKSATAVNVTLSPVRADPGRPRCCWRACGAASRPRTWRSRSTRSRLRRCRPC
jgi:hypothetical protein